MSKKPDSLGKGDWIVHSYYGIGQIRNVETKLIDKKKVRYYKVKAKNSTFLFPSTTSSTAEYARFPQNTDCEKRKKLSGPPHKFFHITTMTEKD